MPWSQAWHSETKYQNDKKKNTVDRGYLEGVWLSIEIQQTNHLLYDVKARAKELALRPEEKLLMHPKGCSQIKGKNVKNKAYLKKESF